MILNDIDIIFIILFFFLVWVWENKIFIRDLGIIDEIYHHYQVKYLYFKGKRWTIYNCGFFSQIKGRS